MGSKGCEKPEKMPPGSKGESKFSFSLPSKPSGKSKARPSEDKEAHEEEDRPEFVNEFDPSKPAKKVKVIPKLENLWRPEKKMKNIQMKDSELQFESERDAKNSDDSKVEYGLNLRTRVSDSMEIDHNEEGFLGFDQNEKSNNPGFAGLMSSAEAERKMLKESIDELPDEAPLEAYASLPVEDFGAALLRGMGWSEEKGIGRAKEPVKPVEYVKRVGREGLGATPAPPVEKPKRFVKPGESREGRRRDLVAAPGPDGRARNVVSVGEKLVERHRKGVAVGKVMCIVEGRHEGLRGEVVEVLGEGSDDNRVVMRLSKSEEKVVVGVGEVAEVGSVEEEDCLQRLKEMRVDGSGHARDGSVQKGLEYGYKYGENGAVPSRDRDRDSDGRNEKHDRRGGDYGSRDRDSRGRDEKHDRKQGDYGSRDRDSGPRDEKHDRSGGDYGSRDEKRSNEMGRGESERDYRFSDERRDSRSREHRKSSNDDNRDEKRHDRRREDRDRQSRQMDAHRHRMHQSEKGDLKGDVRREDYRDRNRGHRSEKGDWKGDGRLEDYHERKDDGMQNMYHDRKQNVRRQDYNDREEGKNKRDEEEEQRASRDKSNRNERATSMKEIQAEEDRRKAEFENKANEKGRSKNGIEEHVPASSWLTSHIRVRVISKDFQGGKLYLKKGRVIDVVNPTTCDLLMDENGVIVQGVKQDILETALPRRGGLVMAVEGQHRGIVGKLLERDSDKGVGLVRKEDTYETLTLSLDHIAEFAPLNYSQEEVDFDLTSIDGIDVSAVALECGSDIEYPYNSQLGVSGEKIGIDIEWQTNNEWGNAVWMGRTVTNEIEAVEFPKQYEGIIDANVSNEKLQAFDESTTQKQHDIVQHSVLCEETQLPFLMLYEYLGQDLLQQY